MNTPDGRPMHTSDGDKWGNWCTCSRTRCTTCGRTTCQGSTSGRGECLQCWDKRTGWKERTQ